MQFSKDCRKTSFSIPFLASSSLQKDIQIWHPGKVFVSLCVSFIISDQDAPCSLHSSVIKNDVSYETELFFLESINVLCETSIKTGTENNISETNQNPETKP